MATLKTTVTANWASQTASPIGLNVKQHNGIVAKYLAFVDSQRSNRTLWFLIILSVHATAFLPVPIFLIGYFNAPVALLGVTMVSFFSNFVANMGGSGVRTTITLFFISILLHVGMIISIVAF